MEWQLKPARDLGLPLARRAASQNREAGLVAAASHRVWHSVVGTYLRAIHSLEIAGRRHLPEPPFVMIANHSSHLDALVLAAALPGAIAGHVHPLAAEDTFFASPAVAVFSAWAVNALPVSRRRARPDEVRTLRSRLSEDGLVYILFPEGSRSRDGGMARFKPGIGALVAATPVAVVPCHIAGAFAAWPPHRRFPGPGALRLAIGQPLTFADVANDRVGWDAVAARCESAVRGLGNPVCVM